MANTVLFTLSRLFKQRRQFVRQRADVLVSWTHIFFGGLIDLLKFTLFRYRCKHVQRRNREVGKHDAEKKIAFVIPWYGRDIGGGAEAEIYGLAHALRQQHPAMHIEILTTTLKEFAADWNVPVHEPGTHMEENITVRRFHPTTPDRKHFHYLNGSFLMQTTGPCPKDHNKSPLPYFAEAYFLRRMIRSPSLIEYMRKHINDYDAFVMIPYMFALTVEACMLAGSKAMLIPCLHHEKYAFLNVYRKAFGTIGASLCHVRSEARLFANLYRSAPVPTMIGEQVDVHMRLGNAKRFQKKYGINTPFLLYAGRQIEGKNVPLMVRYFEQFRMNNPEWAELQLVLIGKGDLDYTGKPGIHSLGFIPAEDKMDAYRASLALFMMSTNESFSIVMMEAWLQETPVIVSSHCEVTSDHVKDCGGGYAITSEQEFTEAVIDLLSNQNKAQQLGIKGRNYVLENFSPEKVTANFCAALEALRKIT